MIKSKPSLFLIGLAALAAFAMMGCEGSTGPQGPPGAAAGVTCTQCHDETSQITGKVAQWEESLHGTGTAYTRGTSSRCAACHSGAASVAAIDAGLAPDELTVGDPAPTRQDCRTCHQIHKTGTDADWALTSTAPVQLHQIEGATFDGGDGNLCVNCHQPAFRGVPVANDDGLITGISEHWGPHHGAQSSMLLGVAGSVAGTSMAHYGIDNTCVSCHMGEGDDHSFEPDIEACQGCHAGEEDFDIGDTQTEVEAMIEELGEKLLAAGLINENSEDGHPAVAEAPEAQGLALWNWIYVAHEDKSKGVHNPAYTKALLQAGLDAL